MSSLKERRAFSKIEENVNTAEPNHAAECHRRRLRHKAKPPQFDLR